MAYLLTHFWPGGTEDQYNATIAVVHPPGGLPEDRITTPQGRPTGASDRRRVGVQGAIRPLRPRQAAESAHRGRLGGPRPRRAAEIVSDGVHQ